MTYQDLSIEPETKILVQSHPGNLDTPRSCLSACSDLPVHRFASSGPEPEGVTAHSKQNPGPSLAPSKLIPLVPGKARGEGVKLSPFGVDFPYGNQKEGAHFPPSRDYLFRSLIPSEPSKDCPSCLFFCLVFSRSISASAVGHPFSGCCGCSCLLHLSSRDPPRFQEQDPTTNWRPANDVCGSKLGHPRTSGGEVSGSRCHPGTGLCRATRRALRTYLSQHK